MGDQPGTESLNGPLLALDLDAHAVAIILYPSIQAEFMGEAGDVGPKADTLHDTHHGDSLTGQTRLLTHSDRCQCLL